MIDPNELHAFADGELDSQRADQIRRLLATSEPHRREYDSIVAMKQAIRTQVVVIESRECWQSCRVRITELDRTRRTERFVGRYSWAICGVFFAVIVAGGLQTRNSNNDSVSVSDMSRIATTLAAPQAPPAQDAARERWLDALLGAARQSVDPNRLSIDGYASGQLDMRPVSVFYLHDLEGRVTLMVMPGNLDLEGSRPVQTDGRFKAGHLGGQNCVVWADGRNTWTLVADRGYEDLVRTASGLRGGN